MIIFDFCGKDENALMCKAHGRDLTDTPNAFLSGEDTWSWNMDLLGEFDVNKLSMLLQKRMAPPKSCDVPIFWNSLVNIFPWRMLLNVLPAKCNMSGTRINSLFSFKNIILHGDNVRTRSVLTRAVFMVTVWLIWHWQNNVLHASQEEKDKILQEDMFSVVQRMANFWITHRKPALKGIWQQWALFC
ncbi:hypothetical protein OSB04_004106 [Centaurea solstitialis]|uniref:Reverse transcriptase n=1 Tax=Centaurea solstitialis TaxID=347529 RepID=A0AA38TW64_9ASTR|nr:hypothetical protein OSB04_004106 [Centaurea solstitialis]